MAGARRRRGGRHEARSPAELTSSAIIHTELSPSLSPPAGRKHGTGNGGWLPSSATWTRWPQPDEPSPSVSTPARCTERGAPLVSCDALPSRRLLNHQTARGGRKWQSPRPRPFGSGVAAAAEVLVGAGCGGWAWRPRSGARPRGVRVGGASNPHAAAAASALHSEHHHGGVQFRPVGLPGVGYGSDVEAQIEKAIYACRFMTFIAIAGSLAGSVPCFLKGCVYVMDAFMEYNLHGRGKVILMLVEAIDMYLIGTVMFVFGTGLYELFISNMDIAKQSSYGSNLFGLFRLPERPKWLEIQSVNDLKTKLGHVIVMVLLVGIFEKSKRVTITSCADLLCFAASIFLSSGCLYLLSRLSSTKGGSHA